MQLPPLPPLPIIAPPPLPPLPPIFHREPAVTGEALTTEANRRGQHPYWCAYAMIEPFPYPIGYMFWIAERREEAKANRIDLMAAVLFHVNRTPPR